MEEGEEERRQGKRRERNRAMERAKAQPRRRSSLSPLLSLAGWSTVSSPRHWVPHFILDLELLFLFSTVLPPSPPYPRYSTLRLDKNRSYHSQLTSLCRPRIPPPQYLSATVTPAVRGHRSGQHATGPYHPTRANRGPDRGGTASTAPGAPRQSANGLCGWLLAGPRETSVVSFRTMPLCMHSCGYSGQVTPAIR